jgi:threonine dehydrogenase-like Zn-dependent dehydrogenase
VLIRVAFAGVCGSDLHILHGTSRCSERVILGHEASGHIAARGPGVPDHLTVGDAVALHPQFSCGQCVRCRRGQPNFCEQGGHASTIGYWHDGCYAEYCVAHWSQVHRVPAQLGLEEAVFCEPFNCIMNGWKKLQEPARDSRILIMGAGIVGLLWASLLHARGYRNGVITEPLPGRRRIAATLCERRLQGFRALSPEELDAQERFDVIVECCGSAEAIEDAYRRLDLGGRLLVFGGLPKGSSITIDPSDILFKELTLCGSVIGQDTFQEGISALLELSGAGYLNLDELGVARFTLSDHAAAFQAVSEGVIAKAIFVVGSPPRPL